VRELENKIKRAVVMAESPIIDVADLGFEDSTECSEVDGSQVNSKLKGVSVLGSEIDFAGLTLKDARFQVESILLQQAIERAEGNVVKAAEELAVSRPTLYDLLKKHGLHQSG
jgi:two-component system NtrC family response regulator